MTPDVQADRVRLHAYVRGRVQAVGFREFAWRHAAALGLTGWVRNLPDGRVELVAEGSRGAVGELLDHVRRGPRLSWVDGVDFEWDTPTSTEATFRIR